MNLFMTEFPEKDELSISHLSRISQANVINSFDSFCSQFVFEKPTSLFHAYNSNYSGSNTGLNFPVYNVIKYLPENDPIVTDPKKYLLEHTLYPVYAPFNSEAQQELFIKQYVHGQGNNEGFKFAKGGERPLLFCPKCMAEDLDNCGFIYAHRCHQVLGVYVCPFHNCSLVYSSTKKDAEMFSDMIQKEKTGYPDASMAYQYAVFCRDLLDNPVNADIDTLEKTISNTVKAISYTKVDQRYLNLAAVDSGFVENALYDPFSFEYRVVLQEPTYISADYEVGLNKSLVKLFLIYRTNEMLHKAISSKGKLSAKDMAQIELNLLTDDYGIEDVTIEGRTANITLKHKECGNCFTTTLRKFANGNRCSCCDTEPDSITEYIQTRTGRHFPLIQDKASCKFAFDAWDDLLSKKEIVQEVNRPVISPVFGITRENKHKASQRNRAMMLFSSSAMQEKFYEFSAQQSRSGKDVSRKAIADYFQTMSELETEDPSVVDLIIDQFAKATLYQHVKWINLRKVG